jgi:hypothetical protein
MRILIVHQRERLGEEKPSLVYPALIEVLNNFRISKRRVWKKTPILFLLFGRSWAK